MSNHEEHVEQHIEHGQILLKLAKLELCVEEIACKLDSICKAHEHHHGHKHQEHK